MRRKSHSRTSYIILYLPRIVSLSFSPSPTIGILVSPTNTFLPPTTNPSANRSRPEESEEDNEETDEQPVQLLAEVGAFDHVVVWDHEKIPEADDLFLRGLGEEGSRWKAGMHAF